MAMTTPRLAALLVGIAVILGPVALHAGPAARVVIESDRVAPRTLETLTGDRVEFLNRTGMPVHLQLTGDGREHEVVQLPITGPIWAVFHRPGTHPYIVHVYGRSTRALEGVVSVRTDETHRWESGTCGVVVEGNCLEP
jgi:hypothetical protein